MKFENLAKFIGIELALEIYTTERTSSLVSNATNRNQFRFFYTKIKQFFESWFLKSRTRNSSFGTPNVVSKTDHNWDYTIQNLAWFMMLKTRFKVLKLLEETVFKFVSQEEWKWAIRCRCAGLSVK